MTIKGAIKPNHAPLNQYKLLVIGVPPLTPTKISGIEEELETVELPDRTHASGGFTKAGEFQMSLPMHHATEIAALEAWFRSGQEPVTANYKKAATLVYMGLDGKPSKSFTLIGLFVSKRKLPDLDMKNEGDMAEVDYTMKWDDILPI
jgi:hypothetical protein